MVSELGIVCLHFDLIPDMLIDAYICVSMHLDILIDAYISVSMHSDMLIDAYLSHCACELNNIIP